MIASFQERNDKPRQSVKKQRHHFAHKGLHSQGFGLSNSHVWMLELDMKQRMVPNSQGCILSPCLFNLYAKHIMQNTGLDELQAGIKIAGKKSTTSDIQMIPL